jgi:predicted nucleic-acid-binding protein
MNQPSQTIVDTNIILRFLVKDQPQQFNQAKKWFRLAQKGRINLFIVPLVIAECCFVLESFYKVDRDEIAQKFQVLLGQRWLRVNQRLVLQNLWPFYQQGFHFVDSYLLSWNQVYQQKILTFDERMKHS